jgi:hypothetical protein
MKLVLLKGGLLLKGGKLAAVASQDPCDCCCKLPACSFTLKFVDENGCEDDAFDIFIYNPDAGLEKKRNVGEIDMVQDPPGCCGGCPQTTKTVSVSLEDGDLSGDCEFGIQLVFKKANCCGTYARFSIVGESGAEVYGDYFNNNGLQQTFTIAGLCKSSPKGRFFSRIWSAFVGPLFPVQGPEHKTTLPVPEENPFP